MKRKQNLYTLILTALLLTGCSSQNLNSNENSSVTDYVTPSASSASPLSSELPSILPNENTPPQQITEADARNIAIEHAELTAEQVTVIKSGIDQNRGKKYYDVEFFDTNQKEYDYEIDMFTGEILEYDHDAEYFPQSSEIKKSDRIPENDVKQIALSKVPGATEQNIRKFHSDYNNGKHYYEGKIYYEHIEYEFEIDGSSGEILEWDIEPIY